MSVHQPTAQAADFEAPIPDFVPLLKKILEKTEAGRIEWNGHPQNYSYSTVVPIGRVFYSVEVEDTGGAPAFAVRDESGRNVVEWNYELEDDPGREIAERLLKAAAESYIRRTNAKLQQLVESIDQL